MGAFNQASRLQGRHAVHKDRLCALFFGTATVGSHPPPHPYMEDFNLSQKRLIHLTPSHFPILHIRVCPLPPCWCISHHDNLQVHCTFLLFLDLFDFYVYEHFSSMYTHVHHMCARYTQKTEQDIGYPGTGVRTVVCCHAGAGNRARVHCSNSKCFSLLN